MKTIVSRIWERLNKAAKKLALEQAVEQNLWVDLASLSHEQRDRATPGGVIRFCTCWPDLTLGPDILIDWGPCGDEHVRVVANQGGLVCRVRVGDLLRLHKAHCLRRERTSQQAVVCKAVDKNHQRKGKDA